MGHRKRESKLSKLLLGPFAWEMEVSTVRFLAAKDYFRICLILELCCRCLFMFMFSPFARLSDCPIVARRVVLSWANPFATLLSSWKCNLHSHSLPNRQSPGSVTILRFCASYA